MGLNDAQEMLDVAKEQALIDERTIIELQAIIRERGSEIESAIATIRSVRRKLAAIRTLIATDTLTVQDSDTWEAIEVWKLQQILDEPDNYEQDSGS